MESEKAHDPQNDSCESYKARLTRLNILYTNARDVAAAFDLANEYNLIDDLIEDLVNDLIDDIHYWEPNLFYDPGHTEWHRDFARFQLIHAFYCIRMFNVSCFSLSLRKRCLAMVKKMKLKARYPLETIMVWMCYDLERDDIENLMMFDPRLAGDAGRLSGYWSVSEDGMPEWWPI